LAEYLIDLGHIKDAREFEPTDQRQCCPLNLARLRY